MLCFVDFLFILIVYHSFFFVLLLIFVFYRLFEREKERKRGRGHKERGSTVKSAGGSSREPGFNFLHPHGSSHLSVTPVPGDLMPSYRHTHTNDTKAHKMLIKKIFEKRCNCSKQSVPTDVNDPDSLQYLVQQHPGPYAIATIYKNTVIHRK